MHKQTEPFLPFTRPLIDEDTIAAVAEVLRSGWLASGPKVAQLETELSRYCGGRPIRTQTSATAGLEMALLACGIGPGDEVITPAMSFVATANVIRRVGAHPVFVDVGLDSRNIDLAAAEAAITPRTRAILPVHFAGLPCDMDRLYALAAQHRLRVIEDAAHAIGSSWRGRRIGSFGDLVVFSFHPNKNMTTIEGGAISGGSAEELKLIELHRWHGLVKSGPDAFDTLLPGGKCNLSDVAAAVGLGQLRRLEEFNAKRRQLVARYYERWAQEAPLRLPERGDAGHSWHVFTPLLPLDELRISRFEFMEAMRERGIGVGLHYPAIHLYSAYRALGYREGQFPNAERIGRETVTLPLFPAMELADVDRVVEAIADVLRGARR
ncbi:MAG: DegT/DnrJ/EryC1/StrS aminotransferase family protein [Gammaproteobacteria bacterium]|nr:DegT/DnrJ/EryC1/StrS aminotransferase family protein [Gammaproteobacteria bacterium]MBV9695851.1 DegT/DnrJ/EryC1/StrS aminotransferase family protein [Gammaproteobacteria bacterium]